MPKLKDIRSGNNHIWFQCLDQTCWYNVEFAPDPLIQEFGESYDLMRLKRRFRCKCGGKNISISLVYQGYKEPRANMAKRQN